MPNAGRIHYREHDVSKKRIARPSVPPINGGLRLSRIQRSLNSKLLKIDEKRNDENLKVYGLSRVYLGAIYAMNDFANVDRFAHAAHGFRELMEKLAWSVPAAEVPIPKGNPSGLKALIHELNDLWQKTKRNTKNHDNGKWSGDIDGHTANLLCRLDGFFEQANTLKPLKAQQGQNLLKHTDFLHYPLPEPIEQIRIQEWRSYDEYFQGIAHHGSIASEEEFTSWAIRFEEFLLARLAPQTSRSKKKIIAIIKEGEGHARP